MPASNQITPQGGYNHIGYDYWSPQTASQNLLFYDDTAGTNTVMEVDVTALALKLDKINELTAAAGVTIDSVLLKDGGVDLSAGSGNFRIANNVWYQAKTAGGVNKDVWRLATNDLLEFNKQVLKTTDQSGSVSITASVGTVSNISIALARTMLMGEAAFMTLDATFDLSGTSSGRVMYVSLPIAPASGAYPVVALAYESTSAHKHVTAYTATTGGGRLEVPQSNFAGAAWTNGTGRRISFAGWYARS